MSLQTENPSHPTSSSDDSDPEKQPKTIKVLNSQHDMRKKIIIEASNSKRHSVDGCEASNLCSESGSEKESGASRDSDSSTSGTYHLSTPKRKTPVKEPIKENKSFFQHDSCARLSRFSKKLSKCRECFKYPDTVKYSCRFFSFRKLRWTKGKTGLNYAGFATPCDATEAEADLWLPNLSRSLSEGGLTQNKNESLDFHVARFILMQVGDQFCDLMHQEEDALNLHMGEVTTPAWKKPMQGVREMCDVCKTTLFNFHWACNRCGFVVCIDCYKVRKSGKKKPWMESGSDHDEWKWLNCTNHQPHEQESLMLCQTIARDCLQRLGQYLHEVRKLFGIPQDCKCDQQQHTTLSSGFNSDILKELIKLDPVSAIITHFEEEPGKVTDSKEHEARIIEEVGKQKLPEENLSLPPSSKNEDSCSDSDDDEATEPDLLGLLLPKETVNSSGVTSSISKSQGTNSSDEMIHDRLSPSSESSCLHSAPTRNQDRLLDIILSTFEDIKDDPKEAKDFKDEKSEKVLQHYVRSNKGVSRTTQIQLPKRLMSQKLSESFYPGVPHSWLCGGRLLRLIDPGHSGNYKIFQDQWRRGQPVIVGNMTKLLNIQLWHPNSFCQDFGNDRNDLINCATGHLVPNRPMREFWEGFENLSKRLKDDQGNPMLLKLKDWPPGEDFASLLPERFNDLMEALPLAEYTRRSGRLNLASCLPDFFVRPDLGPKMYNAYGSAVFPSKGTTNLHLDISDAVNFMVYVGIPSDADNQQHIDEAFRAIDEAGCDEITRRRVRITGEMPGALWHIYHACDADKIRDLLNKVAIERGDRLEPHHDPIHDQNWYLDAELRRRLLLEYDVSGYPIVQCLGDAVFIPAGAPHQVRNLHNCVKVAEDFVSPENVSQCFHLTQEFRELSDTHTNHEDKLQIKNIIYHAIKNAISSLFKAANFRCDSTTRANEMLEDIIIVE